MAYRLTDASALGLDLARTPGGVGAARVLLRLLLAEPQDVRTPVAARGDLAVARVRARELLGPDGPTVLDLTALEDGQDADAGHDGRRDGGAGGSEDGGIEATARRLRRLARRLSAVSFGTVTDLLDLGARAAGDLAGPSGALPEVVVDALLAALVRGREDPAGPVLAHALGHRLDPPSPALPTLPQLLPPGRALLVAGPSPVVRSTAALLARLAAAREDVLLLPTRPAPHVWAAHMHSAAWAVETTGRTRLAAAAQLELLRCLDAAGVGAAACVGGAWNACSAAVQAAVVADVLPGDSHDVLSADLLEVLPG